MVPDETRFIVVQPGQSLGRIAEIYRVPTRAIIDANHLAPPYRLKPGMRLAIPAAANQRATEGTAATSSQARQAKAKRSEPKVIPLDDPGPGEPDDDPSDRQVGSAVRSDYGFFGLDPALTR
jgi:hypothetical protein